MDDGVDLTHDGYLGGRLRLWQPRRGYRAGLDAVMLAASVPAQAGDSLLDLGCGVGAAALCAGIRVPGLRLWGVERQAAMADLARRNGAEAGQSFEVHTGDLSAMPDALKAQRFDHVIANPPYFRRDRSTPGPNPVREAAYGEETPLDAWIDAASRRVRPGGTVTFVHRAARLDALLTAMTGRLGSLEVKPLIPRAGRAAQLVLVRGRKGGRAALCLHDGLLLHRQAEHGDDRPDPTETAQAILRDGAFFPFASSR